MLRVKKVLYPTDLGDGAGAPLRYAVYLARKYQAALHVLHVLQPLYRPAPDEVLYTPLAHDYGAEAERFAIEAMEALLRPVDFEASRLTRVVEVNNSTAAGVLDYAERNDIDLVVMGTHTKQWVKHLMMGSTAEKAVQLSQSPVLTIPSQDEAPVGLANILVPVDFSVHSRTAVRYAKEIAAELGARITLLHVIQFPVVPVYFQVPAAGEPSTPSLETQYRARKELMILFKEAGGPDANVDCEVVLGSPARQIVNFAEANSMDLILTATHGLSGIKHFVLGSVAEKIVRTASCPVLTVKVFGKSLIRDTYPVRTDAIIPTSIYGQHPVAK